MWVDNQRHQKDQGNVKRPSCILGRKVGHGPKARAAREWLPVVGKGVGSSWSNGGLPSRAKGKARGMILKPGAARATTQSTVMTPIATYVLVLLVPPSVGGGGAIKSGVAAIAPRGEVQSDMIIFGNEDNSAVFNDRIGYRSCGGLGQTVTERLARKIRLPATFVATMGQVSTTTCFL